MNLNVVIIAGCLTRDVELRYLPNGTPVARISLAINRTWTNEAGEKQEEVCFVECDAWNKTAELAGQYLAKGSGCLVQGRLKLDQWTDNKTNENRQKLKVVADRITFTDSKPQNGANGSAPSQHRRPPARGAEAPQQDAGGDAGYQPDVDESQVPF